MPAQTLDVEGTVRISSFLGETDDNLGTDRRRIDNVSVTSLLALLYPLYGISRSGDNFQLGGALTGATDIPLSGECLTFSGTGNVGVGDDPAYPLDVNGTVSWTCPCDLECIGGFRRCWGHDFRRAGLYHFQRDDHG